MRVKTNTEPTVTLNEIKDANPNFFAPETMAFTGTGQEFQVKTNGDRDYLHVRRKTDFGTIESSYEVDRTSGILFKKPKTILGKVSSLFGRDK